MIEIKTETNGLKNKVDNIYDTDNKENKENNITNFNIEDNKKNNNKNDEQNKESYSGNIKFIKICNQSRIYGKSNCGLISSYIAISLPTVLFYIFA